MPPKAKLQLSLTGLFKGEKQTVELPQPKPVGRPKAQTEKPQAKPVGRPKKAVGVELEAGFQPEAELEAEAVGVKPELEVKQEAEFDAEAAGVKHELEVKQEAGD